MVGAYIGLFVATEVSQNLVLVLVAAAIGCGLLGVVIERLTLRPLRDANFLTPAITMLGVGIILVNLVIPLFGARQKAFPQLIKEHAFTVGGVQFTNTQVVVLGVSLCLLACLKVGIDRTKVGKAMRATAEDADVAELVGINSTRVVVLTMASASALAGIAGVLLAIMFGAITPHMGVAYGLKALVVMVVGGVGSVGGAMVVGLGLGVIEVLAAGYISSSYRDLFAFALLVVVLLIKPTGIFGRTDLEKI
jgi:branched-chain amino acid transport system permease protein